MMSIWREEKDIIWIGIEEKSLKVTRNYFFEIAILQGRHMFSFFYWEAMYFFEWAGMFFSSGKELKSKNVSKQTC